MNLVKTSQSINEFYEAIKNWKFKDVEFFINTRNDKRFVGVRNRRHLIEVFFDKNDYVELLGNNHDKIKIFTCSRSERSMKDFFDFLDDIKNAPK